jgi:5-methylcytosine-specific restriction endonuclease McrA
MTKIIKGSIRIKNTKKAIPKALREQVWLKYIGKEFETKCLVPWCANQITAFDFHVGHNIPESTGGSLDISNLRPICSRCNLSMGDKYTITQWNELGIQTTAPDKTKIKKPWFAWCARI